MRLSLPALIAATLLASIPVAEARGQEYTAQRNATLSTRGARRIEVYAKAGLLRIEGREGATEVRVRGTARASSRSLLDQIRLIAEPRDGGVRIEAEIPERDRGWSDDEDRQALDLVIEVPSTIPLEVEDGSGDLEIRNVGPVDLTDGSGEAIIESVAGRLRVKDGSGELRITGVRGDVEVEDGSGEIEIRKIRGEVDVRNDGSGELRIDEVGRSVHVGSKGSGAVGVSHVGGDLVIDRVSSRSVDYSDVRGRIDVPVRGRRR
jgi:hypothetical protein